MVHDVAEGDLMLGVCESECSSGPEVPEARGAGSHPSSLGCRNESESEHDFLTEDRTQPGRLGSHRFGKEFFAQQESWAQQALIDPGEPRGRGVPIRRRDLRTPPLASVHQANGGVARRVEITQRHHLGIAVKCADGAARAAEVAMAALLSRLLDDDPALEEWRMPTLRNWTGTEVGQLRPASGLLGAGLRP